MIESIRHNMCFLFWVMNKESVWKFSIGVVLAWASLFAEVVTPKTAWGEGESGFARSSEGRGGNESEATMPPHQEVEISPPGKWIFGLQAGVSMLPRDLGNGNGTVTEGASGIVVSKRLLYRMADSVALGVALEMEEHVIQNIAPVPVSFGKSRTLSSMVVMEFYPPLWPIFTGLLSRYPVFPYGLVGVGQNRNYFTESSAFSKNCNPSSACKVALGNTLAVKVAAGVDYFIAPDLSINAEMGWKLNSGTSRISTTHSEGGIITSNDGYEGSVLSFVVGMRYFFEKPKARPPAPIVPQQPIPVPIQEPIIETLPPPIPIEPVQNPQWVTKEVLFESSSWAISDEAKAFLLDVATSLRGSPQTPIQVEGHADLHGSKEGNLRIAQKRAEAVTELLKESGVTNEIKTVSYGDSLPISKNATPEADRANRRVIIRRVMPNVLE